MAKQQESKKTRLSLDMDPAFKRTLKAEAAIRDLTMGELVERALRDFFQAKAARPA